MELLDRIAVAITAAAEISGIAAITTAGIAVTGTAVISDGHGTSAGGNLWATGTIDERDWNASLSAHRTLIAELDGIIVGFADLAEDGYLDRLYVHRAYQRRGIATALCNALEAGCTVPLLTTHASITARPFFEKRGWKTVRQQTVVRQGVALTNFVMQKERIPSL